MTPHGICVLTADYTVDPDRPNPEWKETEHRKYTSGFHVLPHWYFLGGFDCGKANPTAALVATVDDDGIIYIPREYYQSGFSPKEHRRWITQLQGSSQRPCSPTLLSFMPVRLRETERSRRSRRCLPKKVLTTCRRRPRTTNFWAW